MSRDLRSWNVSVGDQYHHRWHYVVARTRKSAIRQAKRLEGYIGDDLDNERRIRRCEALETL